MDKKHGFFSNNKATNAARFVLLALILMTPAITPPPAAADIHVWNTTDGDWDTATKWTPNTVPAAGDTANLLNNSVSPYTVSYSHNYASALSNVWIGNAGGGSATLSQSAGALVANYEYVGVNYNGKGYFQQTGGTNKANNRLYVGYDSGATGTYTLSATGQLTAAAQYIGYNGSGTLIQTGGTNTVTSLMLGYGQTTSGTYNLGGTGQLLASIQNIGGSGNGTFTQTGGTNTVTGSIVLALGGWGSSGMYILSGGVLDASNPKYWMTVCASLPRMLLLLRLNFQEVCS